MERFLFDRSWVTAQRGSRPFESVLTCGASGSRSLLERTLNGLRASRGALAGIVTCHDMSSRSVGGPYARTSWSTLAARTRSRVRRNATIIVLQFMPYQRCSSRTDGRPHEGSSRRPSEPPKSLAQIGVSARRRSAKHRNCADRRHMARLRIVSVSSEAKAIAGRRTDEVVSRPLRHELCVVSLK